MVIFEPIYQNLAPYEREILKLEKIYNQNEKVIKYHITKKKFQLNFEDLKYELN